MENSYIKKLVVLYIKNVLIIIYIEIKLLEVLFSIGVKII